jgi:hypothetical protein
MAKIHVRNWTGDGSVTVTDMANAGKRGKVCQSFHFQGFHYYGGSQDPAHKASERGRLDVAFYIARLVGKDPNAAIDDVVEADYAAVVAEISRMAAEAKAAGAYSWALNVRSDEIKGINAPKPKLVVVSKKWSARADNDGIHIADLVDHNNEPRMITPSGQTNAKAYEIAAKVWPQVVALAADENSTMYRAGDIFGAAGAKLHSYCAMD